MRLLALLLLTACVRYPTDALPTATPTCLASVTYRWAFASDDAFVSTAAAPVGGPLCLTLLGDRAIVTNEAPLLIPGVILSTGEPSQLLVWGPGTQDTARVTRDGERLQFTPLPGNNLGFLELPGLATHQVDRNVFVMYWADADETLHAEWRPRD